MKKNSRENWSIEKGDYRRDDDEVSKKYERTLKRIRLTKRILSILLYLLIFIIFLITLHYLATI